jgi:hypothetical protein
VGIKAKGHLSYTFSRVSKVHGHIGDIYTGSSMGDITQLVKLIRQLKRERERERKERKEEKKKKKEGVVQKN